MKVKFSPIKFLAWFALFCLATRFAGWPGFLAVVALAVVLGELGIIPRR